MAWETPGGVMTSTASGTVAGPAEQAGAVPPGAHRAEAGKSLKDALRRAWDSLGVGEDQAGLADRVPWQAVYNAACLFAVSAPGCEPAQDKAATAVRFLRLAIDDPACDLEHPSEWINRDPDLRSLRGQPVFGQFMTEQAAKDFAASRPVHVGGTWFREHLPLAEPDDADQAHPHAA